MFKGWGSTFSVMCLVAGTCVGGGILALPVATSLAGFIPSLVLMLICATFMATTGLLFVEANLWTGPGTHLITMSSQLLGRTGKFVTGALYLFIGYASLIAYVAGGGKLAIFAADGLFGIGMEPWVGYAIFTFVFGIVIFLGSHLTGRVNGLLFVSMIAAYVLLVIGGAKEVKGDMLWRADWTQGIYALPLLLTIFSYQAVVPSLVTYLEGNAKRLRFAIVGGALLAFVIYAVWQWLMLGVIPVEGEFGLREKLLEGSSATESFRHFAVQGWVSTTSEFFAFFAIVTSFLGIGLGLFDFLSDLLKVKEKGWNRLWLILLVAVPSYMFAVAYPRAFIEALDATGGFGDAILNGVIPALMVWSGRYYQRRHSQLPVPGGRLLLVLVLLFAVLVFGVEVFERIFPVGILDDLR